MSTTENIGTLSMILVVVLLVQFYLGSYTHKMIGLETIQIIQTIYFSRMIVPPTSTSLLQSMNNIQYSATGYENSELLFSKSLVETLQSESYGSMSPEFSAINLQKYFLLNVNITILPVTIVVVIFLFKTFQKIRNRNQCIENKEQDDINKYTYLRRSWQWIYDHLVFPSIMMLNMMCFFSTILYLTSE